jgi:hypothetical protein
LRSDRKSKTGKLITQPFANVIGTIQTDVLVNLLSSHDINNGFFDRFLYVTLDRKVHTERDIYEINSRNEERYHEMINAILDTPRNYDDKGELVPTFLKFEQAAMNRFTDWQINNDMLCNKSKNNRLIGMFKKLDIYCTRFALILAIMDYAIKGKKLLQNKKAHLLIKQKHISEAIELVEYFRNSAKYIFSLLPEYIDIKKQNPKFMTFFSQLPPKFKTRHALEIGNKIKISDRTVANYLRNDVYFKSEVKGFYEKCFIEQEV